MSRSRPRDARDRPALRAGWRRWLAVLLLGQVLAGTLVPAVQAAPLFTSVFEVLAGDYCLPPEDPDAPRGPHPDHAHCMLCLAGVGAAAPPLAMPLSPAVPASGSGSGWSIADADRWPPMADGAAAGCRGPPPRA